ncbi:MAG: hypothetical protein M1821_000823 [Bathelium mastoideum]|nr:MAG: hypothetical protein M1821_000823 [Bathelium mastoideum]
MSFGFSVSDFLAVVQLAKKIRKDYISAPVEYRGALDVVGSLSLVLEDAETATSEQDLSLKEKTELQTICSSCQNTLNELDRTLKKYGELGSPQAGIGGKVRRAWKRVSLEPEDIRNLRSRVSANIDRLNTFIIRRTRDNTIQIRDNTIEIVRYQERQEQRAINQEEQAILDWLSPFDYFSQQNAFIKQRQPGTGQWLLDSAEFKSWIETNERTLFCPGIPGAGKTILSSIVIEELSARFQYDDSTIVAYIYCDFKRQNEQTSEALLASLLKQLAHGRPSLSESIKSLYDRSTGKGTQPSADDILAALQSAATAYSRVFIVIDALDECRVQDGCRTQILSKLFDLQTKCGTNLFATSRKIPEIIEEVKQDLLLEIRAHEQDVRSYINGRISHLPSFVKKNPGLQQEIKSEIVKSVDGMFLLARLHLDSLIGKKSVKVLRSALGKLPTGSGAYDNAYEAAMDRVEGQLSDQTNLAKQVLSWITYAKRPLTTKELQHALAVEVDEVELDEDNISSIEDIISVCAGLVAVDQESHTIRLVHYTAQEYFERTQTRWFPTAEADITLICVTYLSFEVFSSGSSPTDSLFEERLLLNPLYNYTARYWGEHARQASNLHAKVVEFLQCTTKTEAAVQVMLARQKSRDSGYSQTGQMMGLHLAAYFGITEAVAEILRSFPVDLPDDTWFHQTPLSHAAENGHEAVVKLLLDTDEVDIESKDTEGQTPLSLAAMNGHEVVVRLLLDTGKVDINSRDSEYGQTPLLWAAKFGYEAVVKLLLDTDKADINSKDFKYGRTPLLWAAKEGHEAIVRLLLDTGKVDVDSKDSKYSQTPLSWAAKNGNEAVIRLLLNTGKADINSKDPHVGQTPLLGAAQSGHEAVVKLLLDTGKADVNSNDCDGRTPLLYAAGSGYEAVVRSLLDTGKADINSKDSHIGQTPLAQAAENGHEAVVKLLLDTGKADVNSNDCHGRTPLLHAAEYGYEAVVRLLLDTGRVDKHSKDCWDYTPLRHAEESGYEAVVKLLLDTT